MIMDKFWGFMTLFFERFDISIPMRVKRFELHEAQLFELVWDPDEDQEKFKFVATYKGKAAEKDFVNLVRGTNDYEIIDPGARRRYAIPVPYNDKDEENVTFPVQLFCYLVRKDIEQLCLKDHEAYSLRSDACRGVLYDWEEIPTDKAYAVMACYKRFGQAIEIFEILRRGYEDFGYIDLRGRLRPFELEQFIKFCVYDDMDGVDPYPDLSGIASDDGLKGDE